MKDNREIATRRYTRALSLVEAQIRLLRQGEASSESIEALQAVLAFLRREKEAVVNDIVKQGATAPGRRSRSTSSPSLDDETISKMSLTDVELATTDDSVSLANLKRIAAIRFAFAPGALSRVSRENLAQSLRDSVENERTHETISRLAGNSPEKSPGH